MIKIIVTVGPECNNAHDIKEFSKKTNLFRINGSHGTLDWHRKHKNYPWVCPEAFVLMDIPGIKPRTTNTEDIFLKNENCFWRLC